MSNTLTELREALATLLTAAGLTVTSYLPERPTPPLAIVQPGAPYLARGDTFGAHTATLTVLLLTRTATNEQATAALDEMIVRMAVALAGTDFRLAGVDQPAQFTANGAQYLGATADVTRLGHLEVS